MKIFLNNFGRVIWFDADADDADDDADDDDDDDDDDDLEFDDMPFKKNGY